MSPQKRPILEERFRELWGALDKDVRRQIHPLQTKDRDQLPSKNIKLRDSQHISLDLSGIDLLTGPEFEKFIGQAFAKKGYSVEYHGGPAEAGGDLVCWEGSAGRAHALLVQVKRERSMTGTKAIGQILRKETWFRHNYPDASYEKWVISSSDFSRQAKAEANMNGIILMNRAALEQWLA
jgi:HJR/Mrr/RecB family endonuclease